MLGGARDSGSGSREVRMTTNAAAVKTVQAEPRIPGPEPRHV